MAKNTVSKATYNKLLEIAKESIWAIKERGNLERQNSDSADFIETAVWSLEELMLKAYKLGYAEAEKRIIKDLKQEGIHIGKPKKEGK